MLENLMNLPLLCYKNVTRSASLFGNVMCNKNWNISKQMSTSRSHISNPNMEKGKRELLVNRKMEMESNVFIRSTFGRRIINMIPDPYLPDRLFHNVPFKDIPIVNVKVSKNNTIYSLTDAVGTVKLLKSCGIEGYKNAKKGTNIAAQSTGLTFARKAVDLGYKTIRLRISGMGPGRQSCVKGLMSGGLEIISVTDCTPVADTYPRPKKLRRI